MSYFFHKAAKTAILNIGIARKSPLIFYFVGFLNITDLLTYKCSSRKLAPSNHVEESGCSIIVTEKRGGKNNCIKMPDQNASIDGRPFGFTASSWYYDRKRRRLINTPNEGEDDQVQGVTSDLIEIDGRWFQINDTVPQVYLDELDVLWESNITADAIPA